MVSSTETVRALVAVLHFELTNAMQEVTQDLERTRMDLERTRMSAEDMRVHLFSPYHRFPGFPPSPPTWRELLEGHTHRGNTQHAELSDLVVSVGETLMPATLEASFAVHSPLTGHGVALRAASRSMVAAVRVSK